MILLKEMFGYVYELLNKKEEEPSASTLNLKRSSYDDDSDSKENQTVSRDSDAPESSEVVSEEQPHRAVDQFNYIWNVSYHTCTF